MKSDCENWEMMCKVFVKFTFIHGCGCAPRDSSMCLHVCNASLVKSVDCCEHPPPSFDPRLFTFELVLLSLLGISEEIRRVS
jgi:hypothetical protein